MAGRPLPVRARMHRARWKVPSPMHHLSTPHGSPCCLRQGSARFSSNLSSDLEFLTVPDLRFVLKQANIHPVGSLDALRKQVVDNSAAPVGAAGSVLLRRFELDFEKAWGRVPIPHRSKFVAELLSSVCLEAPLLKIVKEAGAEHAQQLENLGDAASFIASSTKAKTFILQQASDALQATAALPPTSFTSAKPGDTVAFIRQQAMELGAHRQDMMETSNPGEVQEAVEEAPDVVLSKRAAFIREFNLRPYGIGGIGLRTREKLQRSLLSRACSQSMLGQLGVKHQPGLLLFGPPGCGKTLLARGLGKALQAASVQYVTAAEINAKWFGESDQKMKSLFAPALKSKELDRPHDLHIVVMDEIDALAAARSGSDARNHESALNVLLSCLDGFEENDQTLVIGLTNRKDKIDAALLRSGRLGVHVEIEAPTERGREEVLEIHMQSLVANGLLAPNVKINELATRTSGFSGADLRQLVDNAVAFAVLASSESSCDLVLKPHIVDLDSVDLAFQDALQP